MNSEMRRQGAIERRRRVRRHQRSIVIISGTLILLFAIVLVAGGMLLQRNRTYQFQKASLEASIREEELYAEELDQLESYAQTDQYIEEIAREKLGMEYPEGTTEEISEEDVAETQ